MDPDLKRRLKATPALPSLPPAAVRILDIARSNEPQPRELYEAIQLDPALSARLLRASNSPAFRRVGEVRSLREAQMVLGYDATLTLSLSFCLFTTIRRLEAGRLDYEHFWRRSACVASVAALIAKSRGLAGAEAMLAGLLKDIGVLVLDSITPADHPGWTSDEQAAAQLAAEVGAWLINEWRLPDYLASVSWATRDLDRRLPHIPDEDQALVEVVGVADELVGIWLVDDTGGQLDNSRDLVARRWAWSPEQLYQLITEADEAIKGNLALLDLSQFDEQIMVGVMDQAREVLLFQNLSQFKTTHEANSQADALRERARQLEESSLRDELTGVWNRRKLFSFLEVTLEDARTAGTPVTVAFADLDRFKPVNDDYGHAAGDVVLNHFAQKLSRLVRGDDLVARYGGEEFAIVMPNTGGETAKTALTRVLKQAAETRYAVREGKSLQVTASIGMRSVDPRSEPEVSARELLAEADEAAYHAKAIGRAALVASDPDGLRVVHRLGQPSVMGRLGQTLVSAFRRR
ncbi:sensor domain-containing diguanylate cyclase [Alkalilimnicola ehrlichii]|uniref:sensor domain-containing diguanylate cyclase n=1 Tax=Alkalilimnicola ehrlichii TaxID=351052 RepID=UPI003BA0ED46